MTEPTPEEVAAMDLKQITEAASMQFFAQMQMRHAMGERKYGPIKFMEVNTLEEAMEEVVDLANYAMYTYMKLYVLNQQIQGIVDQVPDRLGPSSFMKG